MKILLATPELTDSPLGPEAFQLVLGCGFGGIRRDIVTVNCDDAVAELSEYPACFPIFVVDWFNDPANVAQDVANLAAAHRLDYAIELGNELNQKVDPALYAQQASEIEVACRRIDPYVKVITAGINTTSREGIRWLERAVEGMPKDAIVGFHSYRQDMTPDPHSPQEGFRSRDDEFRALFAAAGGRRLWNTEVGFHTAKREKGWGPFKRCFRLTDEEALHHLEEEAAINYRYHVEVMTVYQINDGPTDTALDKYGVRDIDGNLKPQSRIGRWSGEIPGRRSFAGR